VNENDAALIRGTVASALVECKVPPGTFTWVIHELDGALARVSPSPVETNWPCSEPGMSRCTHESCR